MYSRTGKGAEMLDIESKIISYREDNNDYRLCLTREDIEEIKRALHKQSWVDEVKELIKEGECINND